MLGQIAKMHEIIDGPLVAIDSETHQRSFDAAGQVADFRSLLRRLARLSSRLSESYQIRTRFSAGSQSLSPSFTPKAS